MVTDMEEKYKTEQPDAFVNDSSEWKDYRFGDGVEHNGD